jgi:hypothetical protein
MSVPVDENTFRVSGVGKILIAAPRARHPASERVDVIDELEAKAAPR